MWLLSIPDFWCRIPSNTVFAHFLLIKYDDPCESNFSHPLLTFSFQATWTSAKGRWSILKRESMAASFCPTATALGSKSKAHKRPSFDKRLKISVECPPGNTNRGSGTCGNIQRPVDLVVHLTFEKTQEAQNPNCLVQRCRLHSIHQYHQGHPANNQWIHLAALEYVPWSVRPHFP